MSIKKNERLDFFVLEKSLVYIYFIYSFFWLSFRLPTTATLTMIRFKRLTET